MKYAKLPLRQQISPYRLFVYPEKVREMVALYRKGYRPYKINPDLWVKR